MKKHGLTKGLSLLLVLCLMLSLLPMSALAAETEATDAAVEETTEDKTVKEDKTADTVEDKVEDDSFGLLDWLIGDWELEPAELDADGVEVAPVEDVKVPLDTSVFYRIFHLDCGRKYFTVDQVKAIIDTLAANNYTHLELAIGNDGLRFLLDDMSVTANDTTYSSSAVTAGIQAGNKAYYNAGTSNEWTRSEMDTIISYADDKGIEIIPLLNTPGHMDAILDCMESVGISNPAYSNSARTVDVTNTAAVNFTLALVNKYIQYFAGKGCTIFNMGCDEYANDVSNSGFAGLISTGKYGNFVTYVNQMAAQVKAAGMTPMAFNDGIYYNSNTSGGTFDTDIAIAYWTSGWPNYSPASASFLANKGHAIISTNDAWYYVLGRKAGNSSGYTIATAQNGVQNTACTDIPGDNDPTAAGCMICLWCDTPSASYSATEVSNVTGLIKTFAESNPDYFTASASEDAIQGVPAAAMKIGESVTLSVSESAVWESSNESVVTLTSTSRSVTSTSVTATAVGDGKATITATGDSGTVYSADVTVTSATKEKTITVTVGQTATDTIEGADYSKDIDETELDKSIATVSAKYEQVTGGTKEEKATSITSGGSYYIKNSNGQYLSSSAAWVSDISSAALWTATSDYGYYTLKNGNNYLRYRNGSLSTTTDSWSATTWSFSDGTFSRSWGSSYTLGDAYTVTNTEPVNATTVTFTGVAVGTTYVTVGDMYYKIVVEDKAPDNALTGSSISIEYWITNNEVYTSQNTSSAKSVTVTTDTTGIDDDAGIAISSVVPETAYSNYDGWIELHYWQAMRLSSDKTQVHLGADRTSVGTAMTHIRYHNDAWQYKTSDGAWTYFLSGDQAVAYYMRHTAITKEITTAMKDWGYSTDSTTQDTSSGKGQVALSVAVVYPDGTLSPTEENIYSSSTTIFNYNSNWNNTGYPRDIGIIAPLNNSVFNISKITYTYGSRDNYTSANVWYASDTITWNKKTNDAGSEWFDEKTVWDKSMGTEPVVNGNVNADNIYWTAKNTGILILIYLEPVHYDTNLIVNWVDDSAGGAQISTMEVAVSSDGTPITFYNGLKQTSALPAEGVGGTFTLDDDAYVTNSSNVNQTFNKNISTVPGVAAQYKTGLYKYVSADLSADGKTLTLHYDIDSSKLSKNYVLDFGLPVTVPLSDLVENTTVVTKVEVSNDNVTVNSDKSITFTPSAVMIGTETVRVKLTLNNGGTEAINIGFVPATTVFYDASFVNGGHYTGNTTQEAAVAGDTQLTSNAASNYGYDVAYASGNNASVAITNKASETDYFSFTGTGIDVYANCTTTSGRVYAYLYLGSTLKKLISVETAMRIGETAETGKESESETVVNQAVDSYNTPIISLRGLDHGSYTIKLQEVKSKLTDEEGNPNAGVKISGFRVYDTMNDTASDTIYAKDGEASPVYGEIRNAVLASVAPSDSVFADSLAKEIMKQVYDSGSDGTGAIIISDSGEVTKDNAQDLLDNGPKNELYLAPGQSVTFKVEGYSNVQVGLKAVGIDNAACTVNDGSDRTVSVSNVDMFYKVDSSDAITITNPSSNTALLSVTLVKAFASTSGTMELTSVQFSALTEEDLMPALLSLGFEAEEEAPEEVPVTPVKPAKPSQDFNKLYNKIEKILKRFFG